MPEKIGEEITCSRTGLAIEGAQRKTSSLPLISQPTTLAFFLMRIGRPTLQLMELVDQFKCVCRPLGIESGGIGNIFALLPLELCVGN
jgi:hypothetical protein